jgi:hypothetical protein
MAGTAKASSSDARTIALAAVIGVFLLMQVVLVFAVRHDTLDMDVGPNTQPSPDFYGTIDIGQTFVAAGPNIGRIDLLFGTHERVSSYRIGFELYEVGTPNRLVATSKIEAGGLLNNLFNTFRFPTVRGTRGKTYLVRVVAPSAIPANAVALWMNGGDILPGGTMIYNGAPSPGDLAFRVYARRTIVSELSRIVGKNPGFLGSPIFFVLVILLLEAALVWTLYSIVDRIFERRGPHV